MYAKFWLIFIALPLMVSCQQKKPTNCELWRGNMQYVCRKGNYGMDGVNIRNIADSVVGFTIEKWMSYCGHPGVRYSSVKWHLQPGTSVDVVFYEADGDACNDLFIIDCIRNGKKVDCLLVVTPSVSPRLAQCTVY